MFTVCPKCALTLVVTAADLRIAQGYVRCGRCLNVFNALARLSEERPAAGPEAAPDTAAAESSEQAPAAAEPTDPSSTIDDTGEIEIELDPSILVTDVRPPAAQQSTAQPEAEALEPAAADPVSEASERALAATVVTQTRTQPASATPPPTKAVGASGISPPGAEPAVPAPQQPAVPAPHEPVVPARREPAAPPLKAEPSSPVEAPDAQQTNMPQPPPESAFEHEIRRPRAGLAWKLGAGALALALALQIVNHYRDTLAADPALSGPLSTVYSSLGVKLAPRWNIHAYDVRQLGASVAGTAAGQIVVRASVKNSGSRAQPLPLLRVTLQDRFGNRIAARDVPPDDYLPSSVAPSALLAAGGRVDATMVFVDPGPQAVGFEIDACLRQGSGEVACAHGP